MLELFKAKYAKLVEQKATQAKELIGAEEAKLQATVQRETAWRISDLAANP